MSELSTTELETGQEASFSITYDAVELGGVTALLQIASNDANESPFDIQLSAIGLSELEGWRSEYFGTTTNSGDAADDFDFDEDGLSNLLEFGLGTLPKVSDPSPMSLTVDGTDVEVSYQRSVLAMSDFLFEVVWADALPASVWSPSGVTESILSEDGLLQEVEASFELEASSKRFFQLRMSGK